MTTAHPSQPNSADDGSSTSQNGAIGNQARFQLDTAASQKESAHNSAKGESTARGPATNPATNYDNTQLALSRSSLDRKIIRVQRDVLKMGALVENSCLLAREALCDRNLDSAKKIPIQDKQIDTLYRQIEVDCTNLLTLEAPVTQDLRMVSAFMQMIRDLERIGDYAKSIGAIAIKLFPFPVHDCMADIETMLDRCRSMVALCLRSLSELDPIAGRSIKQKDDVVDDDYTRLYEQLVSTPCNPGASVEAIVLMVLVIRSLERIADHATNVGKRVTFVVTGERF
ncbi:MAG: phosphate signaling complex protein PhoU [Cyanobacteria bacterium P01_F01_bin.53]